MPANISIFGLGAMGTALASKYLEHGYKTTVWNRTPSKATPLVEKGAQLASTVSEGISASNIIIICLLDNPAVENTLQQALPPSSLAGKTIINLTNGTPSQARKLSEWVTSQSAHYIHGGIMAVPIMIGSPHAVLLYSGNSSAFETIKDNLAVMGTSQFLGTDAGSASLHDVALLAGMCGLFSGFFHATALAKSAGGTATGLLPLLVPWLTAMTGFLGSIAKQIDERNYATEGSNLSMQLVGVKNIIKTSEEQGVSSLAIQHMRTWMESAVTRGHGGDDISALIKEFGLE